MDYPIWDVPYLGGSLVIAIIAIGHIFIAHFAIGAGLFNAVTETLALRRGNGVLRRFLRDHSLVIILLPFVGGVVSGVGIWFSIALVSPESTSLLIHVFLWGWATEWVLFLVEIVAGYVYYYTWERLGRWWHCLVGWVYAVAAFLSMVVINGIVTFMLTPGEALDSSARPMGFDFWVGLFNPTYWPSLLLRTVSAMAIVALFVMVLVNASRQYSEQERAVVVRQAGRFLVPLVLMVPGTWWYFQACPPEALLYLKGGAIAMTLLFAFSVVASLLIGLYAYGSIILGRRRVNLETAVLMLALALIATGGAEFVREGVRKPYLIWGHVYSNGMIASEVGEMVRELSDIAREEATVLRYFPWGVQPGDATLSDESFKALAIGEIGKERHDYPGKMVRGKWIYRGQCLRCHAVEGYNGMTPLVYQWSPKLITHTLERLDEVKNFMPPFVGTIRDKQDLTYYLHGLNGACGRCHENLDDEGRLTEGSKVELRADREERL